MLALSWENVCAESDVLLSWNSFNMPFMPSYFKYHNYTKSWILLQTWACYQILIFVLHKFSEECMNTSLYQFLHNSTSCYTLSYFLILFEWNLKRLSVLMKYFTNTLWKHFRLYGNQIVEKNWRLWQCLCWHAIG